MGQALGEPRAGVDLDQHRRDGHAGQHRGELVAQRAGLGGDVLGGQRRDDELPVGAEPDFAGPGAPGELGLQVRQRRVQLVVGQGQGVGRGRRLAGQVAVLQPLRLQRISPWAAGITAGITNVVRALGHATDTTNPNNNYHVGHGRWGSNSHLTTTNASRTGPRYIRLSTVTLTTQTTTRSGGSTRNRMSRVTGNSSYTRHKFCSAGGFTGPGAPSLIARAAWRWSGGLWPGSRPQIALSARRQVTQATSIWLT